MTMRLQFASILSVALTISAVRPAFALSILPPSSYATNSPDGEYVFVMISYLTPEGDERGWSESHAARIREIRAKYKQSGMYRNDGSNEPVWSVDWYARKVLIASDGSHLIRHWPMGRDPDPEREHIGFFAEGRRLRGYTIDELTDCRRFLPREMWWGSWLAKESFDDQTLTYRIRTMEGNRFTFDMRTGEIISAFRPIRLAVAIVEIVAFVLLIRRLAGVLRAGKATQVRPT